MPFQDLKIALREAVNIFLDSRTMSEPDSDLLPVAQQKSLEAAR